eukprot:TRINITY_DN7080_c0_g2_i2.p1 TRINITY_DN7080_c0_g2~~TRINITY_DN7080_c0_g2_i2.p1  ORF type:complete len:363 (-),score=70.39 TRINITY_DN7080_c0_g2_i2:7-1071(-)
MLRRTLRTTRHCSTKSTTSPPVMRSLLFIPGNQPKKLAKLFEMDALPDVLVPDLEDSVPQVPQEKDSAAHHVATFLGSSWSKLVEEHAVATTAAALPQRRNQGDVAASLPLMYPRLNFTERLPRDIDIVGEAWQLLDGFVFGKVETPADIERIHTEMLRLEKTHGLPANTLRAIPSVETPLGVTNAFAVACHPRVIALAFGHDDYRTALGTTSMECLPYALSAISVAAAAAGKFALDSPFAKFKDSAGLLASAQHASGIGCKGKFAIHPAQVAALNGVFTVSAAEETWATRAIAAFDEAQAAGKGATSVDSQMVDIPVYKRALLLKARADLLHNIDQKRKEYLARKAPAQKLPP